MDSVRAIVEKSGYDSVDDLSINESITVKVEGFHDLVIEKIVDDRLSVMHSYTQRGDLMSDPEIVFRLEDDDWVPVRYTQHPSLHKHDEDGLDDVADFVETWDKNLRAQGFVDAVENGGDS